MEPAFDVPFVGSYNRTAKVTYRNGRRVTMDSSKGTSTLKIEPGLVTFYVQYAQRSGGDAHVTQTYSFTAADMHPVTGGYDVPSKDRT